MPQAVRKTTPAYPYKARERGIEGYVAVKFMVREDGSVFHVRTALDRSPVLRGAVSVRMAALASRRHSFSSTWCWAVTSRSPTTTWCAR